MDSVEITNPENYDAVVVGAGPCGSIAAENIAQANFRVLLLERDNYPGQFNSCAGGLGYFLLEKFDIPSTLIQKTIRQVSLTLGNKSKIYRSEKPIYVSVKRTELDPYLAQRAAQAGAELRCRQKVIDYNPEDRLLTVLDRDALKPYQIRGKVVIFADGPRSLGWRTCRIGVDNQRETVLGIAYELAYPQNSHNVFEFILDEQKLPGGYFWVFPTKDTLNVGIGGPREVLKKSKRELAG